MAAWGGARAFWRAYDTPAAANKECPIFGPEAWYCAIAHRNLRVRAIPFWLAWTIAILGRQAELRAALPILRYCAKLGEEEDPSEANALLGAPTTTLVELSKQQATAPPTLSPVA